mgnify:CR=1 FL=1
MLCPPTYLAYVANFSPSSTQFVLLVVAQPPIYTKMLSDNCSLWLGFFNEIGGNPLFRYIKKISGTSGAKTLPQIKRATRLRCKIIILLLYHGSAKTVAQEQSQHAVSLANGRTKKEHTS